MTKTFKLTQLDCANCAAKMERAIQKIDGVSDASINFMAMKLTIEADETHFDDIIPQAIKICHKIESGCEIIVQKI